MNRVVVRIARASVGAALILGALTLGCGSNGTTHSDSSVSSDAPFDQARDAGSVDSLGDGSDDGGAAPTPGTGSKLIIAGEIDLIGSGPDTCTNQVPATGDRWCGFSKTASNLVSHELWVVNVSKIAEGVSVRCDATVADPNCIRLSMGLYSDATNGFSIHGFDGDTLHYSEDPSAATSGFIGYIFAWRPGWAQPHGLTGGSGLTCSGHQTTKAAVCLENPVADSSGTFVRTAELHAGILDDEGGTLPLIATVIVEATNDATNVTKWGAALSPDGTSIAWSTRTADDGTEDLHWQRLGDTASGVDVATDVDQWSISADSQKWFWLKAFNYDANGAPSGTLQSAPYPGGATPLVIATNAGDYLASGNGLYYRTKVSSTVGSLLLLPNRDAPSAVTTIDTGVAYVFSATKDGKYVSYTKNVQSLSTSTNVYVFDLYVGGSGQAAPCALSTQANALIPPSFLNNNALMAWGRINSLTQVLEATQTTLPGCKTTAFGSNLYGMTVAGDEGLVYLDTLDPSASVNEATLRYGKITNGTLPAPGAIIQARAGLEYATLVPSLPSVLYIITASAAGADGLYLNSTLPFAVTATVSDAGTGDSNTSNTDGRVDTSSGG